MLNPSDPRYKSLVSVLGVLAFVLLLANFSVFASNWFSKHMRCGFEPRHRMVHEFVSGPTVIPVPPPPPLEMNVDMREMDREMARARQEIRMAEIKMRRAAREHARAQAIHRIEIRKATPDGQSTLAQIEVDPNLIPPEVQKELARAQAEIQKELQKAQVEIQQAQTRQGREIHVVVK